MFKKLHATYYLNYTYKLIYLRLVLKLGSLLSFTHSIFIRKYSSDLLKENVYSK